MRCPAHNAIRPCGGCHRMVQRPRKEFENSGVPQLAHIVLSRIAKESPGELRFFSPHTADCHDPGLFPNPHTWHWISSAPTARLRRKESYADGTGSLKGIA